MGKHPRPRLNACAVIASCVLLCIDALIMSQPAASAQADCPNIPKLGSPFWEPNYSVTVVFQNDSNWTDDEILVMKSNFDNWSASRFANGTNSGPLSNPTNDTPDLV